MTEPRAGKTHPAPVEVLESAAYTPLVDTQKTVAAVEGLGCAGEVEGGLKPAQRRVERREQVGSGEFL